MKVQGFPQAGSRLVDPQTGVIEPVWYRLLASLFTRTGGASSSPDPNFGPMVTVAVETSPQTFVAPARGALFLSGGSVSKVTFTRGPNAFDATGWFSAGWIPVAAGDVVQITYTTPPTTFRFMPG